MLPRFDMRFSMRRGRSGGLHRGMFPKSRNYWNLRLFHHLNRCEMQWLFRCQAENTYCSFPKQLGPNAGGVLRFVSIGGSSNRKRSQYFPQIGILSNPSNVQLSKRHLFIHGAVRGVPHLLVWNIAEERQVHLIRTAPEPVTAMTIAPDESLVFLGDPRGALECINLGSESSEFWVAPCQALFLPSRCFQTIAPSWPQVQREPCGRLIGQRDTPKMCLAASGSFEP